MAHTAGRLQETVIHSHVTGKDGERIVRALDDPSLMVRIKAIHAALE